MQKCSNCQMITSDSYLFNHDTILCQDCYSEFCSDFLQKLEQEEYNDMRVNLPRHYLHN